MEIAAEIKKMAEDRLVGEGQFIVDVIVSQRGAQKVMVIVDGDSGVNIDDCANLSRELSKALDESSLMNDQYFLEVSTPGVDQPLKLIRQYKKHIGRKVKVKLHDKSIEGKLKEVEPEKIVVDEEMIQGKKKDVITREIPFTEIDKTFVLVSFK